MNNKEINIGDLVEYVDAEYSKKLRKTIKISKRGIWDGEKVILDDKAKTTVRNKEWLKLIVKASKVKEYVCDDANHTIQSKPEVKDDISNEIKFRTFAEYINTIINQKGVMVYPEIVAATKVWIDTHPKLTNLKPIKQPEATHFDIPKFEGKTKDGKVVVGSLVEKSVRYGTFVYIRVLGNDEEDEDIEYRVDRLSVKIISK